MYAARSVGESFSSRSSTAEFNASPRSAPKPGSLVVSTSSGSHGPAQVSRRARAELEDVDRESRGRGNEERQRISDRAPISGLPPNPDVLDDVLGLSRAAQHPIRNAKQARPGA